MIVLLLLSTLLFGGQEEIKCERSFSKTALKIGTLLVGSVATGTAHYKLTTPNIPPTSTAEWDSTLLKQACLIEEGDTDIYGRMKEARPLCSAILISPRQFLSAAHCFSMYPGNIYRITCKGQNPILVKKIHYPPELEKKRNEHMKKLGSDQERNYGLLVEHYLDTKENDLAIVEVEEVLPFTPVRLSSFDEGEQFLKNKNPASIYGFGLENTGRVGHPHEYFVENLRHEDIRSTPVLHASSSNPIAASGDSGSGLVARDSQGEPLLIGIYVGKVYDMDTTQDKRYGAYFVSVISHEKWIRRVLKK